MSAPVCRVCGTGIDEAPRLCPRCDTPHHRDCWDYMGRCSVYGCTSVVPVGEGPVERLVVEPIVAVFGAGKAVWVADEAGAWIGAPHPSIPVIGGTQVVMLPAAAVAALRPPSAATGPELATLLAVMGMACVVTVTMLPVVGLLVFGMAAVSTAVGVAAHAFRGPRADIAWLARDERGLRLCTMVGGKVSEVALEGPGAPRRVRLARSFRDSVDGTDKTLLTFDLVLDWPRDPDRPHEPVRLAPPLQMPALASERRPLLEKLVAQRRLGEHIALALRVPFEEGVAGQ